MRRIQVVTVVGARPQFIKAAAVTRAVAAWNETHQDVQVDERIVHTGQHYDRNMSAVFFDQLKLPRPVVNLGVGSGTHGVQTGAMLERLERVLLDGRPDWVLVYGDTNSTLAGALAAVKLHIPLAHVEAGLRSFNRRMPEEINRVVVDHVSSLLLCPTDQAVANLASEGVTEGVHNVGDVMYDSLLFNAALAEGSSGVLSRLGLEPKTYYLATVHRAENTDDPARLGRIVEALGRVDRPVVLPMHPRTRKTLGRSLDGVAEAVRIIEPVAYLDMLTLERGARIILTDSGGVQKEAYWLAVPCVTLRDETEWVELIAAGCNRLGGADAERIVEAVSAWESVDCALPPDRPQDLYGDGKAAERIVELLAG